jgi:hypothetical protein
MKHLLAIAGPFLLFAYGAHAAECSTNTLQGEYGFTVHGRVLSPDGTTSTALIDGVGKATFDGAGNLTQEEATVVNGVKVSGGPANASFSTGETGTYIVDADCSGMMTLDLGPGGTRTGGFVITRRGQALHGIVTGATINGAPVLMQTYADYERLDAR